MRGKPLSCLRGSILGHVLHVLTLQWGVLGSIFIWLEVS